MQMPSQYNVNVKDTGVNSHLPVKSRIAASPGLGASPAWFGSINVFIQFFLQIFAIIFITHISTKEKRGSIPTNTVSTTLIHDSIEHFFHKKGNAGHIASQGSKGWGSI